MESQILSEIANNRYQIVQDQPLIVSALGAIPKKNSSKIRIIHDCSRPQGDALNDFAENVPFSYQSISDAVDLIRPNSYLAKLDLMEAYRSVKIHPQNFCATGIQWTFTNNDSPTYLVDTRLPFGAKCSPFIFTELSQAVCRIMARKYNASVIAYLDDFLIVADTKEECNRVLHILMALVRKLGFSINYSKVCSPSQRLTFLGVVLDSVTMTLELPREKCVELQELLKKSIHRRKISKRNLQSIAGKLNWACQCIYGGRFHVRRIQDKINELNAPWHVTRVTQDMKADFTWWIKFMDSFNGKTPMLDTSPTTPVYIDACGVAAGGFHDYQYVYTPWAAWPGTKDTHINDKETLALEPATVQWAHLWKDKKVIVMSDNQAAVSVINRGTSRNPFVMDSLRRVFWWSAKYNFRLYAIYFPGRLNAIADSVSRLHEPGGPVRLLKHVFPD